MTKFTLDERVRLAIELAMTDCRDPARERRQESAGRNAGMSGAEIDAAAASTSGRPEPSRSPPPAAPPASRAARSSGRRP